MAKNSLLITFVCMFLCLGITLSSAQETDKPKEKGLLKQVLNGKGSAFNYWNVARDEIYEKEKGEGEAQPALETMLSTLKNPFIPQLPEKETEVINQSPITLTSNPETEIDLSQLNYEVSGIVWNTNRPQAILNKRIVDVGDKIDSWVVSDISQKGVELRSGEVSIMIEPLKGIPSEIQESESLRRPSQRRSSRRR